MCYRRGAGAKKKDEGPSVDLQSIKQHNPQLFKDIVQDVIDDYESVEDIPDHLPIGRLSPELRNRVANTLSAIESNNALGDIAPARINQMLKHLGKSAPLEGDEIITPEEAQELLEKAKNREIQLKDDELKALKRIAMADPDFEFEEVKLSPQENRQLDNKLDIAEVDIEELKRNYPDLYKELKKDIADVIAATGKVPKSIKASALSAGLASKLAANGVIQLDPTTEDLLAKREEEEAQQKALESIQMRQKVDDAIAKLERLTGYDSF